MLFEHLKSLHPPSSLSDYMLGVKTCALVTVFSLSRLGSVAALAPRYQVMGEDIIIPLIGLEKNSRRGKLMNYINQLLSDLRILPQYNID